ncbi:hypothetical protein SK128_016750, partial [Halocaridina rubra]
VSIANVCDAAACTIAEFQCGDGACIDKTWVCDDFPDCDDRSDEPPIYDCSATSEDDSQDLSEGEISESDEEPEESEETSDGEDAPSVNVPAEEIRQEKCSLKKCQGI